MKKWIIAILLVAILPGSLFGAMTQSISNVGKPTSYWWTGTPMKDYAWIWGQEVETVLEAWTIADEANDIITFPTNGLTLDNATDGALTITEASEDLILTFTSNDVGLSSSSGVLAFDFQSIYIALDEISAPVGNPAANKGWIYTKDDTGTTKLYFEDSAGTVTDLLAAGTGVTLDGAYDFGGAGVGRTIDVDTGAVELTVSDGDNNVALSSPRMTRRTIRPLCRLQVRLIWLTPFLLILMAKQLAAISKAQVLRSTLKVMVQLLVSILILLVLPVLRLRTTKP